MEIFDQTVWITAVGMGLTFAAIGLLVLAMVALTRWTRGQAEDIPGRKEPSGAIPADEGLEEMEQAAAVAVAVAMAMAARRAHPTHAWHAARPEEEPSPWQAYARGQQLEQRKTHQTLRW
jgi:Na+-transporting methylmalonyl-CoA/oxaloacetate decarboxylase gamma subunit